MITFQEFRTKNDPYNGVVGYSYDVEKSEWVETSVSEDTKELIADWFDSREIGDEPARFARFFRRKMNSTALRYAQLRRIELSAFDPLVANYTERETINTSSRTGISSREGNNTVTKNNTTTRENTSTITDERTGNTTDSAEGSRSGNTTSNTTSTSSSNEDDKSISKQAPQSIANVGAVAGKIPDMDWTYATAQGQNGKVASTSGTENNEGTSGESNTDTRTGTSKSNGTTTNTSSGSDVNQGNEIGKSTESNSTTESGNDRNTEISSGRGGLTPQDAFKAAADYLKKSSAWEWLQGELEELFLCIYDI